MPFKQKYQELYIQFYKIIDNHGVMPPSYIKEMARESVIVFISEMVDELNTMSDDSFVVGKIKFWNDMLAYINQKQP